MPRATSRPPSPLKVLFLTPPAKAGRALAAQSFVEEEIRAFRDFEVEPYVLTDEIAADNVIDGVRLVGLPRRGAAAVPDPAWLGLQHAALVNRMARASGSCREVFHALRIEATAARLIARERIEVIHSHFGWPAGLGGALAARTTGTPLVTSVRGTDVLMREDLAYGLRQDPAYDIALKHLFRVASRILVATSFMQTAAMDAGADPGRIQVVDKGVDLARFRPAEDRIEVKRRLGVSGPLVLAVGSLQRRKGFETIIDALAALGRPDATLAICGTGEERPALQKRAQQRGVASQVRFEGQVSRDRISDYFAASDVFVHAAELEAAGNVILEAQAAGTAVIVTDSGGPAEYVDDGVTGFVIGVGDAGALASRLEALLSSPSLRQRLASGARQRVEHRHTYSRMMSALRGVYDDVWREEEGCQTVNRERRRESIRRLRSRFTV
jgi:glycosyltransferase involved in cell wall biosynthesis